MTEKCLLPSEGGGKMKGERLWNPQGAAGGARTLRGLPGGRGAKGSKKRINERKEGRRDGGGGNTLEVSGPAKEMSRGMVGLEMG